jgi:hypothetical protein
VSANRVDERLPQLRVGECSLGNEEGLSSVEPQDDLFSETSLKACHTYFPVLIGSAASIPSLTSLRRTSLREGLLSGNQLLMYERWARRAQKHTHSAPQQ